MKHYPNLLSQSVPKNFARSLADRHGQAGSKYAALVCFGSVWSTDSTARAHKTPMKQVICHKKASEAEVHALGAEVCDMQ